MSFIRPFLIAAALPLFAFLALGLYLQPLSGDLTRLGNLAERSWGWNAEQPVLYVHGSEPGPAAPVLVIGDSFAEGNLWQSIAADRLGVPFLSFHWSDIGAAGCLPAALAALKRRFPAARTLVVEAVERTILRRFGVPDASAAACGQMAASSILPKEEVTAPRRNRYADPLPDPVYAIRALLADFRARDRTVAAGQTLLSPLTRSDLFSNRESGWLLYIGEDVAKYDWRREPIERALRGMRELVDQGRSLGLDVVIALVPDKSTAYAPYFREEMPSRRSFDFWAALDGAGLPSVNLLRAVRTEVGRSVDLYLPDDTHLGQRGYVLMGEGVAAVLAHR